MAGPLPPAPASGAQQSPPDKAGDFFFQTAMGWEVKFFRLRKKPLFSVLP